MGHLIKPKSNPHPSRGGGGGGGGGRGVVGHAIDRCINAILYGKAGLFRTSGAISNGLFHKQASKQL